MAFSKGPRADFTSFAKNNPGPGYDVRTKINANNILSKFTKNGNTIFSKAHRFSAKEFTPNAYVPGPQYEQNGMRKVGEYILS